MLKHIAKAFAVIAMIPTLLIGGIAAMSLVAPLCFEGLSHPLFSFLSIILLIPWGLVFFVVFFVGVEFQPSFVITPTGRGGYYVREGKDRGGGMILSIMRLVLMVPLAWIVWLVISVIMLFRKSLRNKIDELYEQLLDRLKEWYRIGIVVFVVAPLIVLGMNALENAWYSPKGVEISYEDMYYESSENWHPHQDDYTQIADNYGLEYSINLGGKDILNLWGDWEFVNKKTGETERIKNSSLVPFGWYWRQKDNKTDYHFETTVCLLREETEKEKFLPENLDDVQIRYRVTSLEFKSNIPILGDFLFPTIENTYKDGYILVVKP